MSTRGSVERRTSLPEHTHTHTHLFSSAGDQALVQAEGLFLREALSLVVPEQSPLDLRAGEKGRAGGREGAERREARMKGKRPMI